MLRQLAVTAWSDVQAARRVSGGLRSGFREGKLCFANRPALLDIFRRIMMKPTRLLLVGSLAAALCVLLTVPQFAADFGGMLWTTDGTFKVQVKRLGKTQETVMPALEFAGSTFEIRDDAGDVVLTGTYVADSKGKAELTPDPSSLSAFLNESVLDIIDAEGYKGSVTSLEVTKQSLSAKCKSSSKGLQVSLKVAISAEVFLDITSPEPMPLGTSISVKANLKGTIPPDAAVTKWSGDGKSKISIQGFGSEKGQGRIELTFGARDGVPMGFYSFNSIDDGITLSGAYSQDGATVDMTGFAAQFASVIEKIVSLGTGESVQVTVVSDKSSFKYKPSDSGKMSSKIKYNIVVPKTGDSFKANVSINAKLDSV